MENSAEKNFKEDSQLMNSNISTKQKRIEKYSNSKNFVPTPDTLSDKFQQITLKFTTLSFPSLCYILIYMFMQHHNDTIIKTDTRRKTHEQTTQEGRLLYNSLPLTLLQGFERVVQGLHMRGSWRPNINCNFLTPLLWPSCCVFLVLLMLGPPRSGVAFPTTSGL